MNIRSIKLFLAAAGLVAAASAQAVVATPYSALYVFGDSLSDAGNNSNLGLPLGANPGQTITGNTYIPTQTYGAAPFGTYSNGQVWASYLATSLGVSALPSVIPGLGGTNYAFGGATTSGGAVPSLLSQTSMFLNDSGGAAPSNALYVVAGGGNNARDTFAAVAAMNKLGAIGSEVGSAADKYAGDVKTIVDQLWGAGARNIIVWNTPNVGLTPGLKAVPLTASGLTGSQLGEFVAGSFNGALENRLSGVAGVKIFDVYGFMDNVVANPGAFGFTDVSNACGATGSVANCATSLFYDAIHPTTFAHQTVAAAVFALAVPEPSEVAMMLVGILVVVGASRRKMA